MSAVLPTSMARADATSAALPAEPAVPIPASAKSSTAAADRLVASRVRLRAAMMDIAHPPTKTQTPFGAGVGHLGDLLLARLRSVPGAAIIAESVQSWWDQHPLRTAGAVAEEATRSFVIPVARRNPLGLVGAAALAGALLALTRPWRWLLRPALFVGLVPQLLAHAMKRMPAASWFDMINKLGRRKAKARTAGEPSTPPVA